MRRADSLHYESASGERSNKSTELHTTRRTPIGSFEIALPSILPATKLENENSNGDSNAFSDELGRTHTHTHTPGRQTGRQADDRQAGSQTPAGTSGNRKTPRASLPTQVRQGGDMSAPPSRPNGMRSASRERTQPAARPPHSPNLPVRRESLRAGCAFTTIRTRRAPPGYMKDNASPHPPELVRELVIHRKLQKHTYSILTVPEHR